MTDLAVLDSTQPSCEVRQTSEQLPQDGELGRLRGQDLVDGVCAGVQCPKIEVCVCSIPQACEGEGGEVKCAHVLSTNGRPTQLFNSRAPKRVVVWSRIHINDPRLV